MDSLDGLLDNSDPESARYLMLRLLERATAKRVPLPSLPLKKWFRPTS